MNNEVSVRLPDGKIVACARGTPALKVLQDTGIWDSRGAIRPVAVFMNNEPAPLGMTLEADCTVAPIWPDHPQGAEIYRRSLCFLLAFASRKVFSSRRLTVSMAIGNGYYHYYDDDIPLAAGEIERLAREMRALVAQDLPITVTQYSYHDALEYFRKADQPETLALLEYGNDPFIALNECNGFKDLYIAPLVPSTGMLDTWELIPYKRGMLLRFPHTKTPGELDAFSDIPVLYDIAEEYERKGRILHAPSIGALNRINQEGRIQEFIMIAEALQNKKLSQIADTIAEKSDRVRVVLIAGPSSSGKTSTAKKLAIQLKALGIEPVPIELDNYFVDRIRTPLDEDGKPDFECLEALDIEFLNHQLLDLFEGRAVELPLYDFKSGVRKNSGKTLSLRGNEILILEGIHGLNDRLTPLIPHEQKLKIYVSALTQLNLDDHNRVRTTDYRLLRRMVRDYNFRGHGARQTLAMWSSVQRGERKYIFPFQGSADIAFNSALDYELGVLKLFAEPLLKLVKPDEPEYTEARRIQAFIDRISPISPQFVPGDSILREFIGGSMFKY